MFLTILIFIIILGILVFVHELGHFIVAKKSGMQVDEFGFGFPPRIIGIQKIDNKWRMVWGYTTPSASNFAKATSDKNAVTPPLQEGSTAGNTVYSINAIPLGGFVRILGENNEHEGNPRSFINRPFWARLLTLVAGVLMNVILAWALLSVGYAVGLPVAISDQNDIPAHASFSQPQTAILEVIKDLPAAAAGLKANDIIIAIDNHEFAVIKDIQTYVKAHAGQQVTFKVHRGSQDLTLAVVPNVNPAPDQGPTGIELALVGKLKYPPVLALWEGGKTTVNALTGIVAGLYQLFAGRLGFASLGGPVKIAKLTGEVAGLGFVYLLQFTAFLSLNLAVLNILPFPALDGGRVLFLLIEKIRRKKNNQKVEQIVNTAGFVFLILLMIAVTINDVVRK